VIEITNTLLQKVEILLDLQVGDLSRLTHIRKMILDNKTLYTTDQQYIENLTNRYLKNNQNKESDNFEEIKHRDQCRNCKTDIPESSNYCPFCGMVQNRHALKKNIFLSRSINNRFNPLHYIGNLNSYQIISIIGGFAALLPILIAMTRIDDLVSSIEAYTGKDSSYLTSVFMLAGVISSMLSCIAIGITFVIKNPKRIARILFFIAFAILITSILVGIIGFVFILFASIFAFKKRRY
jgi:hypothetical protein